MTEPVFPFSAIVGQEPMRVALVVNAVDPTIGGVLIRGHKGTGKSTVVRALAQLLPPISVVDGCRFGCDPAAPSTLHEPCAKRLATGEPLPARTVPMPLCELPLNATEDRLVGSLHVEQALRHGTRQFEPGLLAAAHRGILYVDEVNLLEDHLVDLLLDVAASGINRVEREGVSAKHDARLLLVGTMNPEEGELRPQLLDRFGLCVSVRGLTDPAQRESIVRRRLAYEVDPQGFATQWSEQEAALSATVERARRNRDEVRVADAMVRLAVRLAAAGDAHGHRAEIAILKTARALAALLGKQALGAAELADAARYALPHRCQGSPLGSPEDGAERIDDLVASVLGTPSDERPAGDLECADEVLAEAEAMQVPGGGAAGSVLFVVEKKSPPEGSSTPPSSSA